MSAVIALIKPAVITAGSLICAWGAVTTGINIPQHNGQGVQNGLLTIVGGGVIIAAGALFVVS